MKLHSKYFDTIRIASKKARKENKSAPCAWEGCSAPAEYKAPIGRGGGYYFFCLEHVKEYNKNYNYFSGMDQEALFGWQEAHHVGHRPTWRLGENVATGRIADRLSGLSDRIRRSSSPSSEPLLRRRLPQKNERRALETLGLSAEASAEDIKARYKELVKKFHPDTNGGCRDMEDRFREIVQAYDYLKTTGYGS